MEIHPVSHDHSRLRLFGNERWNVWDLRRRLGVLSHDLQRHYLADAQAPADKFLIHLRLPAWLCQ